MSYQPLNMSDSSSTDLSNAILRCPFPSCHARIIPLTSQLLQSRVKVSNFPNMVNISDQETESEFFKIDDVWDFDNIGVSRPASDLKEPVIQSESVETEFKIERLLVCSECDKGPLGFAGQENGNSDVKQLKYFLCSGSVLH